MTFPDTLKTDLRYAWRSFTHSRSFAAVTILTLTAGVGLASAIFSVVNGVLLRPLPMAEGDRVVTLSEVTPQTLPRRAGVGDELLGVWLEKHAALEALAPFSTEELIVSSGGEPQRMNVARVGAGFFDVIRVPPLLGRLLQRSDGAQDAAAVAVISARTWKRLFGGAPDAISKVITLETTTYTVVGVLPDGFAFPERELDAWVPGKWRWPAPGAARSLRLSLRAYGRLADGATPATVEADGNRAATVVAMGNPAFFDGTVEPSTVRAELLQDALVAPVRPALLVLSAGIGFVLLAACVNLANLLLARNTARTRDLAVRVALGAGRLRLLRPLLIEQVLLALIGGVLGAVTGWWILRGIVLIAPPDLPRLAEVRFDLPPLAFACTTALLTALLVTVVPGWRLPAPSIRSSGAPTRGRSADRTRSVLVALQVALASVLLVSAVLVGRSLDKLLEVDPGYAVDGVLTFQVAAPQGVLRERGRLSRFYEELLVRLRTLPSVRAAGTSTAMPLHDIFVKQSFQVDGQPAPPPGTPQKMVTVEAPGPGYVEATGMQLVDGRLFSDTDTANAPKVALANEAFAREWLKGESAVGKRLVRFNRESTEIIGVVKDVLRGKLHEPAEPTIYLPAAQTFEVLAYGGLGSGVAVRTTGDPMDIVPFIREQVRSIEPAWPVHNVMRLDDRLSATLAEPRFYTIALALFALMAVSTAILGLYGILSYAVERRRLEIGVRRALGATERHLVVLVMGRALVLAVTGLSVGLVLAGTGGQLIRSLLFGVEPLDPASFVTVAAVVLGIVLLASWAPLRTALRFSPSEALRQE